MGQLVIILWSYVVRKLVKLSCPNLKEELEKYEAEINRSMPPKAANKPKEELN